MDDTFRLMCENKELFTVNFMKSNYNDEEYWRHCAPFPDDFVERYSEHINFGYLLKIQKMSIWSNQLILKRIIDNDLVRLLLLEQKVPMDGIIYLVNNGDDNWDILSCNQVLSEEFMDMYRDRLDWIYITERQTFGIEFMLRNREYIRWDLLHMNKNYEDLITDEVLPLIISKFRWVEMDRLKLSEKTLMDNLDEISETTLMNLANYGMIKSKDEDEIYRL